MVSQNLLKSDFILTMEQNKFYWMASHWNVTILKVRDLWTDQYKKKSSYIFRGEFSTFDSFQTLKISP